jgi:L-threonylcarbamoyladenylate synthase
MPVSTNMLGATPDAIREAAALLRAGRLVAFPTETVYGLGADAANPEAVRRMFAAKGRPADHPVIVHVADAAAIEELAASVPDAARRLAAAFWPGPMTLVLRRSRQVSDLVTGGLDTVGLRVPAHPAARALLIEFGGPVAAPSANRFGRVSATCAEHVLQELAGHVDLILDGGPCPIGLESTIIDLSRGAPVILRPGAVTAEQVAALLGSAAPPRGAAPRVSGNLPSHYAPHARVEVVPPEALSPRALALAAAGKRVAVLAAEEPRGLVAAIRWVPIPAEQAAWAQSLYASLRRVDELGCDVALTTLPEEAGLGTAIADRLRRAAGPREAGE